MRQQGHSDGGQPHGRHLPPGNNGVAAVVVEEEEWPRPHPRRVPPPPPRLPKRVPPRRVDHTYRDYSNFPSGELPAGTKMQPNFPGKLHQILSTPAYSHIISWMPHGRAWKVHDKDLLVREVISKHFVQSKYESFTRQLNGWGFKRLHQAGNDFNACYHECFLRGLPHLTALMRRAKPNKGKLIPHVEGEPNFYNIERQFPLPPDAPTMVPYDGAGHEAPRAEARVPFPPPAPMPRHQHERYRALTHVANGYGNPPGLPTGAPLELEPSVGYQYSTHPSNNARPPPHHGHHGDPYAAPYATHSSYPPSSYHPSQYCLPPPQHYLNCPDSPQEMPSHYAIPPLRNARAGKIEEFPRDETLKGSAHGFVSISKYDSGEDLEPLSFFSETESENTAAGET